MTSIRLIYRHLSTVMTPRVTDLSRGAHCDAIRSLDPFHGAGCVHLDLDDVGSILGITVDTLDYQVWNRGSEQLYAVGAVVTPGRSSRLVVAL